MSTYAIDEEWRDVEEFPGWSVSDLGRVMNDLTGRVMSTRRNAQGLTMVNVQLNGKLKTRLMSHLVQKAFGEEPKNESYNSVIHLNGDHGDCRASNLMWRPRWYALKYHKMFDEDPTRVAVYIPAIDEFYPSLREFCTTYGLVENYTYVDMFNGTSCFHYGWNIERAAE